MSGYLLSVIGVVLVTSFLSVVIPRGKTSKLVSAASKLACIVAILTPIPTILKGEENTFFGKTIIESDEAYIKYCSEMRVEEAAQNLQSQLREKYDESLEVALKWGWESSDDEPTIKIYQADISSNNLTEKSRREIECFLKETYGIEASFYEKC